MSSSVFIHLVLYTRIPKLIMPFELVGNPKSPAAQVVIVLTATSPLQYKSSRTLSGHEKLANIVWPRALSSRDQAAARPAEVSATKLFSSLCFSLHLRCSPHSEADPVYSVSLLWSTQVSSFILSCRVVPHKTKSHFMEDCYKFVYPSHFIDEPQSQSFSL